MCRPAALKTNSFLWMRSNARLLANSGDLSPILTMAWPIRREIKCCSSGCEVLPEAAPRGQDTPLAQCGHKNSVETILIPSMWTGPFQGIQKKRYVFLNTFAKNAHT